MAKMEKFNFKDNFLVNVKAQFLFLKEDTNFYGAVAKGIVLPESGGILLPINYAHLEDEILISLLAKWRQENNFAYPSKFKVTFEGTKKWLKAQVLENSSRILFLIVDRQGKWVGHLGLGDCLNNERRIMLDNILRGNKDYSKGIMGEAVFELMEWARKMFVPTSIYLKVLDDNLHAIDFYNRLGFKEELRIPLVREERPDGFVYVEIGEKAKAERYFVQMVFPQKEKYVPQEPILTAGPFISSYESFYVADATRFGWNRQWDKYLRAFESSFAKYIGVKHAIATSSGTGALHIALLALGIGKNDEVIVPDLTWVATGQAVNYVGAIPVFADVQQDTWCLDPVSLKKQITKKTKAVIPVHLYGHPAEMDKILEIAKENSLFVIEDAAPSIGAECSGRRTGSFGDFSMFSFQGAKLAVTGEGGMLLTSDDVLYERARKIWDQGRRPGSFWIDEVGWKYKMSNIQAALGLGQLEHVNQLIAAKRQIFSWYEEFLGDCSQIKLAKEADWAMSIYWMTSILVEPTATFNRDELILELKKHKIDTRPVFPAMSQFGIWPKKQKPQPNADDIGKRGINLPSGVCLKKEEIKYIADTIKKIFS